MGQWTKQACTRGLTMASGGSEVVFTSEQVWAVIFSLMCLVLSPLSILAARAVLRDARPPKPSAFAYRRTLNYLNAWNSLRGLPIQYDIHAAQWRALGYVQLAIGIGLIVVGVPLGIIYAARG